MEENNEFTPPTTAQEKLQQILSQYNPESEASVKGLGEYLIENPDVHTEFQQNKENYDAWKYRLKALSNAEQNVNPTLGQFLSNEVKGFGEAARGMGAFFGTLATSMDTEKADAVLRQALQNNDKTMEGVINKQTFDDKAREAVGATDPLSLKGLLFETASFVPTIAFTPGSGTTGSIFKKALPGALGLGAFTGASTYSKGESAGESIIQGGLMAASAAVAPVLGEKASKAVLGSKLPELFKFASDIGVKLGADMTSKSGEAVMGQVVNTLMNMSDDAAREFAKGTLKPSTLQRVGAAFARVGAENAAFALPVAYNTLVNDQPLGESFKSLLINEPQNILQGIVTSLALGAAAPKGSKFRAFSQGVAETTLGRYFDYKGFNTQQSLNHIYEKNADALKVLENEKANIDKFKNDPTPEGQASLKAAVDNATKVVNDVLFLTDDRLEAQKNIDKQKADLDNKLSSDTEISTYLTSQLEERKAKVVELIKRGASKETILAERAGINKIREQLSAINKDIESNTKLRKDLDNVTPQTLANDRNKAALDNSIQKDRDYIDYLNKQIKERVDNMPKIIEFAKGDRTKIDPEVKYINDLRAKVKDATEQLNSRIKQRSDMDITTLTVPTKPVTEQAPKAETPKTWRDVLASKTNTPQRGRHIRKTAETVTTDKGAYSVYINKNTGRKFVRVDGMDFYVKDGYNPQDTARAANEWRTDPTDRQATQLREGVARAKKRAEEVKDINKRISILNDRLERITDKNSRRQIRNRIRELKLLLRETTPIVIPGQRLGLPGPRPGDVKLLTGRLLDLPSITPKEQEAPRTLSPEEARTRSAMEEYTSDWENLVTNDTQSRRDVEALLQGHRSGTLTEQDYNKYRKSLQKLLTAGTYIPTWAEYRQYVEKWGKVVTETEAINKGRAIDAARIQEQLDADAQYEAERKARDKADRKKRGQTRSIEERIDDYTDRLARAKTKEAKLKYRKQLKELKKKLSKQQVVEAPVEVQSKKETHIDKIFNKLPEWMSELRNDPDVIKLIPEVFEERPLSNWLVLNLKGDGDFHLLSDNFSMVIQDSNYKIEITKNTDGNPVKAIVTVGDDYEFSEYSYPGTDLRESTRTYISNIFVGERSVTLLTNASIAITTLDDNIFYTNINSEEIFIKLGNTIKSIGTKNYDKLHKELLDLVTEASKKVIIYPKDGPVKLDVNEQLADNIVNALGKDVMEGNDMSIHELITKAEELQAKLLGIGDNIVNEASKNSPETTEDSTPSSAVESAPTKDTDIANNSPEPAVPAAPVTQEQVNDLVTKDKQPEVKQPETKKEPQTPEDASNKPRPIKYKPRYDKDVKLRGEFVKLDKGSTLNKDTDTGAVVAENRRRLIEFATRERLVKGLVVTKDLTTGEYNIINVFKIYTGEGHSKTVTLGQGKKKITLADIGNQEVIGFIKSPSIDNTPISKIKDIPVIFKGSKEDVDGIISRLSTPSNIDQPTSRILNAFNEARSLINVPSKYAAAFLQVDPRYYFFKQTAGRYSSKLEYKVDEPRGAAFDGLKELTKTLDDKGIKLVFGKQEVSNATVAVLLSMTNNPNVPKPKRLTQESVSKYFTDMVRERAATTIIQGNKEFDTLEDLTNKEIKGKSLDEPTTEGSTDNALESAATEARGIAGGLNDFDAINSYLNPEQLDFVMSNLEKFLNLNDAALYSLVDSNKDMFKVKDIVKDVPVRDADGTIVDFKREKVRVRGKDIEALREIAKAISKDSDLRGQIEDGISYSTFERGGKPEVTIDKVREVLASVYSSFGMDINIVYAKTKEEASQYLNGLKLAGWDRQSVMGSYNRDTRVMTIVMGSHLNFTTDPTVIKNTALTIFHEIGHDFERFLGTATTLRVKEAIDILFDDNKLQEALGDSAKFLSEDYNKDGVYKYREGGKRDGAVNYKLLQAERFAEVLATLGIRRQANTKISSLIINKAQDLYYKGVFNLMRALGKDIPAHVTLRYASSRFNEILTARPLANQQPLQQLLHSYGVYITIPQGQLNELDSAIKEVIGGGDVEGTLPSNADVKQPDASVVEPAKASNPSDMSPLHDIDGDHDVTVTLSDGTQATYKVRNINNEKVIYADNGVANLLTYIKGSNVKVSISNFNANGLKNLTELHNFVKEFGLGNISDINPLQGFYLSEADLLNAKTRNDIAQEHFNTSWQEANPYQKQALIRAARFQATHEFLIQHGAKMDVSRDGIVNKVVGVEVSDLTPFQDYVNILSSATQKDIPTLMVDLDGTKGLSTILQSKTESAFEGLSGASNQGRETLFLMRDFDARDVYINGIDGDTQVQFDIHSAAVNDILDLLKKADVNVDDTPIAAKIKLFTSPEGVDEINNKASKYGFKKLVKGTNKRIKDLPSAQQDEANWKKFKLIKELYNKSDARADELINLLDKFSKDYSPVRAKVVNKFDSLEFSAFIGRKFGHIFRNESLFVDDLPMFKKLTSSEKAKLKGQIIKELASIGGVDGITPLVNKMVRLGYVSGKDKALPISTMSRADYFKALNDVIGNTSAIHEYLYDILRNSKSWIDAQRLSIQYGKDINAFVTEGIKHLGKDTYDKFITDVQKQFGGADLAKYPAPWLDSFISIMDDANVTQKALDKVEKSKEAIQKELVTQEKIRDSVLDARSLAQISDDLNITGMFASSFAAEGGAYMLLEGERRDIPTGALLSEKTRGVVLQQVFDDLMLLRKQIKEREGMLTPFKLSVAQQLAKDMETLLISYNNAQGEKRPSFLRRALAKVSFGSDMMLQLDLLKQTGQVKLARSLIGEWIGVQQVALRKAKPYVNAHEDAKLAFRDLYNSKLTMKDVDELVLVPVLSAGQSYGGNIEKAIEKLKLNDKQRKAFDKYLKTYQDLRKHIDEFYNSANPVIEDTVSGEVITRKRLGAELTTSRRLNGATRLFINMRVEDAFQDPEYWNRFVQPLMQHPNFDLFSRFDIDLFKIAMRNDNLESFIKDMDINIHSLGENYADFSTKTALESYHRSLQERMGSSGMKKFQRTTHEVDMALLNSREFTAFPESFFTYKTYDSNSVLREIMDISQLKVFGAKNKEIISGLGGEVDGMRDVADYGNKLDLALQSIENFYKQVEDQKESDKLAGKFEVNKERDALIEEAYKFRTLRNKLQDYMMGKYDTSDLSSSKNLSSFSRALQSGVLYMKAAIENYSVLFETYARDPELLKNRPWVLPYKYATEMFKTGWYHMTDANIADTALEHANASNDVITYMRKKGLVDESINRRMRTAKRNLVESTKDNATSSQMATTLNVIQEGVSYIMPWFQASNTHVEIKMAEIADAQLKKVLLLAAKKMEVLGTSYEEIIHSGGNVLSHDYIPGVGKADLYNQYKDYFRRSGMELELVAHEISKLRDTDISKWIEQQYGDKWVTMLSNITDIRTGRASLNTRNLAFSMSPTWKAILTFQGWPIDRMYHYADRLTKPQDLISFLTTLSTVVGVGAVGANLSINLFLKSMEEFAEWTGMEWILDYFKLRNKTLQNPLTANNKSEFVHRALMYAVQPNVMGYLGDAMSWSVALPIWAATGKLPENDTMNFMRTPSFALINWVKQIFNTTKTVASDVANIGKPDGFTRLARDLSREASMYVSGIPNKNVILRGYDRLDELFSDKVIRESIYATRGQFNSDSVKNNKELGLAGNEVSMDKDNPSGFFMKGNAKAIGIEPSPYRMFAERAGEYSAIGDYEGIRKTMDAALEFNKSLGREARPVRDVLNYISNYNNPWQQALGQTPSPHGQQEIMRRLPPEEQATILKRMQVFARLQNVLGTGQYSAENLRKLGSYGGTISSGGGGHVGILGGGGSGTVGILGGGTSSRGGGKKKFVPILGGGGKGGRRSFKGMKTKKMKKTKLLSKRKKRF